MALPEAHSFSSWRASPRRLRSQLLIFHNVAAASVCRAGNVRGRRCGRREPSGYVQAIRATSMAQSMRLAIELKALNGCDCNFERRRKVAGGGVDNDLMSQTEGLHGRSNPEGVGIRERGVSRAEVDRSRSGSVYNPNRSVIDHTFGHGVGKEGKQRCGFRDDGAG